MLHIYNEVAFSHERLKRYLQLLKTEINRIWASITALEERIKTTPILDSSWEVQTVSNDGNLVTATLLIKEVPSEPIGPQTKTIPIFLTEAVTGYSQTLYTDIVLSVNDVSIDRQYVAIISGAHHYLEGTISSTTYIVKTLHMLDGSTIIKEDIILTGIDNGITIEYIATAESSNVSFDIKITSLSNEIIIA